MPDDTLPSIAFQTRRVSPLTFGETLNVLRSAILSEEMLILHEIDTQKIVTGYGVPAHPITQLLFFHPRFIARILDADARAVIQAPLKLVVQEEATGVATVDWIKAPYSFAAYKDLQEVGEELEQIVERIAGRLTISQDT